MLNNPYISAVDSTVNKFICQRFLSAGNANVRLIIRIRPDTFQYNRARVLWVEIFRNDLRKNIRIES